MEPILHTLETTGSGYGYSYYSKWAGCPKRATLDQMNGPYQTADTRRGNVFHALLEMRDNLVMGGEGKALNPQAIKFSPTVDDDLWLKVQDWFFQYQSLLPMRDLGFPQALEWGFDTETVKDDGGGPRILGDIMDFGVRPFSGRIDKVTRIDEKDLEFLESRRQWVFGSELLRSGIWLVDHKTSTGWYKDIQVQKRLNSHQATAYMMAWNAMYPAEQCKGFIFNEITLKAKVEVRQIVLPLPSLVRQNALKTFLAGCQELMNHPELNAWPNSSEQNCFSYFKACPYLGNECTGEM